MANHSKWKDEYPEQARKLCLLGATDTELADFFGIARVTLHEWKKSKPGFAEAIMAGKRVADAEVASKLYQKAVGYRWTESQPLKVKVSRDKEEVQFVQVEREIPPDTTSMIWWLKNRAPDKWKDRPVAEEDDKRPIHIEIVNPQSAQPDAGSADGED